MTEAVSIVNPFPVFNDANGVPLDNGKLYVGVAGSNPKGSTSNLLNLYLDKNLSKQAENPLNIIDGFIVFNNKRVHVYASTQNVSIVLDDKNGTTVASNLDFSFETKVPDNITGVAIDDCVIGALSPSTGKFTSLTATNGEITTFSSTNGSITNLVAQASNVINSTVEKIIINMASVGANVAHFFKGAVLRGGLEAYDADNYVRLFKSSSDTGAVTSSIDLYDDKVVVSDAVEAPKITQKGSGNTNDYEGLVRVFNNVHVRRRSDGFCGYYLTDDILLDNLNNPFVNAYLDTTRTRASLVKATRNSDGTSSLDNWVSLEADKTEIKKGIQFTGQTSKLDFFEQKTVTNIACDAVTGTKTCTYQRIGNLINFTIVIDGTKSGSIGSGTVITITNLPYLGTGIPHDFLCNVMIRSGTWQFFENGTQPEFGLISNAGIRLIRSNEAGLSDQTAGEMPSGSHYWVISGSYMINGF